MDRLEFAQARLAEDEQAAKGFTEGTGFARLIMIFAEGSPAAEAISRRVLREVEAGRRILARYQDCLARMEDPGYPQGVARDQVREYEDFVLPNLLVRWADHPDYDQGWKP